MTLRVLDDCRLSLAMRWRFWSTAWSDAAGGAVLVVPQGTRGHRGRGVRIARVFIGEYATSMEMAGASISLLKLDEELLGLLDAPA